MQRWSLLALAALVVGAIVLVVVDARRAAVGQEPIPSASASGVLSAPVPESSGDPLLAIAEPTAEPDGGEGQQLLPDGRPVPDLAPSAPKSVGFGVILFTYKGAQGAPKDARSKEEALKKAKEAAGEAARDFEEAAKKGDPGSTADAGRMPRGVLEKPLEYLLFTLDKGAVYPEPLDSPRGYWLLKRND